jgi:MFS transporter, PPP family, 3-phenylpropionic acid transporter
MNTAPEQRACRRMITLPKKSEMVLNQQLGKKLTVHYSIIQIVFIMGYCTMLSFAAVFLLSRGLTNTQVGITLTLGSILSLFLQPMIASFTDGSERFSLRAITAVVTAVMAGLSYLLLILPPLVFPTMILYMLLVAIFSPQIALVTSLAMEHINNGVPINFSLARGFGSASYALLSLSMGFLVEHFGSNAVMFVNLLIALVGAVLVLRFKKPEQDVDIQTNVNVKASGLWSFVKTNKRFVAIVFSIALLFFSHILINTYLIQIITAVGGSNADMGVALAISGSLELPAMALFPLLSRRIRYAGTMMKISGLFVVIKAVVTFFAASVTAIYVAQTLQFFSFAIFLPASVYYVNQVIQDADKVKGQSFMVMALAISNILGNSVGGVILDYGGGVPVMLIAGIAVSILGLLLLFWLDKGARKKFSQESM